MYIEFGGVHKTACIVNQCDCTVLYVYLQEARCESSSGLTPDTTVLMDAKIGAVVLCSQICMLTAAKC